MAADNQRGALFRTSAPHQHSRVTYAELFFDLVFVFRRHADYRTPCWAA